MGGRAGARGKEEVEEEEQDVVVEDEIECRVQMRNRMSARTLEPVK